MKKLRKGFTLVELLIVIAVLGALAATMAISSQKATGLAKAQSIVNNLNSCKVAAFLYYSENRDDDLASKTAGEFLKDGSEYIPNWKKFSEKGTKYSAGTGQGFGIWDVKVDFTGDADAKGITTALKAIRGFDDIGNNQNFTIELSTGKITAGDASTSGGSGSSTGGEQQGD